MHVIEVIPLTLLPPNVPQILSYFFDSELPKGAVVEIPLNNRKVKAVVIASNSLEKQKLSLKKVDFQIKKLTKVLHEEPQISDYQLKLSYWLAKYYYAPLGYTLKTILPPFAFKKKYPPLIHNFPSPTFSVGSPQLLIYKTKALVKHLEPLMKEVGDKQVLILVPEKASIPYFADYFHCPALNPPLLASSEWWSAEKFGAGSKKYSTAIIHSGLSNEKIYDTWKRAGTGETQIVIGTRQALNMSFNNLGLLIVDDPLHEFYKSDMVPRYNAAKLAEKVAELNNAQLVLTSVVPGVENYYKFDKTPVDKRLAKSFIHRVGSRPKFDTEIIDMAQEIKDANWSIFSKKLSNELVAHIKDKKKILLFSSRRGYAGILVCGNCGSAAKCPQCEVAMRTHRSVEMLLVCHHCGISKPAPRNCSVCEDHNLRTVGPAGTQKIYDGVRARLTAADSKCPVLAIDTDIIKNETEEKEVIAEISKPGAAVLVATQMVFSHRFYLNFDLIGVINADALTNIPDFRSEENLFYQMEKLVNFLPKKMLIQTYNPENKLIENAAKGDYEEFYEKELKLREALNYPPFFKLVKLTFRHNVKEKASYAARITTEKLKTAVVRFHLDKEVKIIEAVPAYIEKEKGLYVYNIFLKVREGYQDYGELLKYAGPGWHIDVEPRSLL